MDLEEYGIASEVRSRRLANQGVPQVRRFIGLALPRSVVLLSRLLVAVSAILMPSLASGWGSSETHQGLLEAAIDRALDELDYFVEEHYALEDGLYGSLYVRPGIASGAASSQIPEVWRNYYGGVEKEFERGRFVKNLGRCAGEAPLGNTLPNSPLIFGFPRSLLLTGAWAEDNPNPRASNHFHDPEVIHPGAITERGLDNKWRGNLRTWLSIANPQVNALFSTCRGSSFLDWLGGESFELIGASPTDWGFHGPGLTAPNLFDIADAERFLYRAVTGRTQEEREHAMALHFLALGHVIHLLEDMGSPAHTRNDFVFDHVIPGLGVLYPPILEHWGMDLEGFGEEEPSLQLLSQLRNNRAGLFVSRARTFLEGANSLPFNNGPFVDVTQFAQFIPPPEAEGFDATDFWDSQLLPHDPGFPRGLAEVTHNNFFSRNTVPFRNPDGYTEPRGSIVHWCQPLPVRSPDGGVIRSEVTGSVAIGFYQSTALVPHLAHCNFYAREYGLLDEAEIPPAETVHAMSAIEHSVQRDYLELIWPMVIEYVREFLLFYLSPRIEVVPIGENKFTLRNLTHLEFRFDSDALEIVYTDVNGERQTVYPDCGSESSVKSLPPRTAPDVPAPAGGLSCAMPTVLPVEAANPLEFWLVVRGAMGDRGEAASPDLLDSFSSGDFVEDFVVAFQRVRPEIVYQGVKADTATTDAERQHDLYRIGIDLSQSLAPGDRSPLPKNVTAPYRAIIAGREELSELEEAELDFGVASTEPNGARMVLLGDADGPHPEPEFPERFFPTEPWLLDPLRAPQDGLIAFRRVEVGALKFVRRLGRDIVWDRSEGSSAWVSFLGEHQDPPYWYLVQRDIDAGVSNEAIDPGSDLDRISVGSAFENRVAAVYEGTAGNLDLVMLAHDTGSGSVTFTHLFDVSDPDPDARRVVACDPSCPASSGRQEVDPDFSPKGDEVVFVSQEQGDWTGDLMIATVGNEQGDPIDDGPIRLIEDAAGQPVRGKEPAFSPDGRWIVFVGDDWNLWVIPAEGVANKVRVTIDGERKYYPSWLPSLELGP